MDLLSKVKPITTSPIQGAYGLVFKGGIIVNFLSEGFQRLRF